MRPGLRRSLRIDRMVPGFKSRVARMTRKGDKVRIEGQFDGETLRIESDYDAEGRLVEVEIERHLGNYRRTRVDDAALPEPALREVERVLGADLPQFQRSVTLGTSTADIEHFAIKGRAGDWKWEIVVTPAGRLLEVEKELRSRH